MKKGNIGLFALNFIAYAGIQALVSLIACVVLYYVNEQDRAYIVPVGAVSFCLLCIALYKAAKK